MDPWEFAGGEYHLVNVFNTFFLLNSIAKLIMITRPPHSFASLIDFLWPVKNSFQNYWLQLFFEPLFGRQKINFSVRSFIMKPSGRTVEIFYSYLFCLKKHLLLFIFQFFMKRKSVLFTYCSRANQFVLRSMRSKGIQQCSVGNNFDDINTKKQNAESKIKCFDPEWIWVFIDM